MKEAADGNQRLCKTHEHNNQNEGVSIIAHGTSSVKKGCGTYDENGYYALDGMRSKLQRFLNAGIYADVKYKDNP